MTSHNHSPYSNVPQMWSGVSLFSYMYFTGSRSNGADSLEREPDKQFILHTDVLKSQKYYYNRFEAWAIILVKWPDRVSGRCPPPPS